MPSGGDWALYRGGAVLIENCVGCNVTHTVFSRVDNNAVMLSGYCRETSLDSNVFEWLGMSAMAAWGYTDEVRSKLTADWHWIDPQRKHWSSDQITISYAKLFRTRRERNRNSMTWSKDQMCLGDQLIANPQ